MAAVDPSEEKKAALDLGATIRWDDYVKAGSRGFADEANLFFTKDCINFIKAYEGQPLDSLDELLETEGTGHEYAMSLLAVLSNVTDEPILRYTITLVEDLLDCTSFSKLAQRVDLFRSRVPSPSGGKAPANVAPVLRLVNISTSPYVVTKAAKAAAILLSFNPVKSETALALIHWIHSVLRSRDAYQSATGGSGDAASGADVGEPKYQVSAAVSAVMSLVQNPFLRSKLVENGVIEAMIPVFSTRNPQLLYEAVFSFWVLSLDAEACAVMDRVNAVQILASIARLDGPVKVLRLSLGVLANITALGPLNPVVETSLAAMSETPLPAVINQILDEKKLEDPELMADAATLKAAIDANLRVLTSMERYDREVTSKQLRWTAVHTTEFWKENFKRFEEDNFRLIRALAEVITSAVDVTTLAVACYDIGEFARFHPHGRLIIDKLRIKTQVMGLLKSEDEGLRRQALLCCSKLMVSRWQFVDITAAPAK